MATLGKKISIAVNIKHNRYLKKKKQEGADKKKLNRMREGSTILFNFWACHACRSGLPREMRGSPEIITQSPSLARAVGSGFIDGTNLMIWVPPEYVKDGYVQKSKEPLSRANPKRYNMLFVLKPKFPQTILRFFAKPRYCDAMISLFTADENLTPSHTFEAHQTFSDLLDVGPRRLSRAPGAHGYRGGKGAWRVAPSFE